MRRFAAVVVGVAALGAFPGAGLANHSGPEDVAKGRGAFEATSRAVVGGFGFPSCAAAAGLGVFCTEFEFVTAVTFDFDAVLSSHEASTTLGEPHGHMKQSFTQTVTRQEFVFGEPAGPPTTTTQTYAATADVTCLTVVNNRAVLSGRVTRFEGNVPPQRGLLFNATDNTIARQQVGGPDRFAGTLQPEALQACPPPSADSPINKGDILIEDN